MAAAVDMVNFPPFYSMQPNPETWTKQRSIWCELILNYSRDNKISRLDLNEPIPLFHNKTIQRRVPLDMAQALIDNLVQTGNAEWENKEKTRCLIIWRSPDEWGSIIYSWVESASLINNVFTVYELLHGEDTADAAFHDLEPTLFRKALAALEKRGKAHVFSGSTPEAEGVKFV